MAVGGISVVRAFDPVWHIFLDAIFIFIFYLKSYVKVFCTAYAFIYGSKITLKNYFFKAPL